MSRPKDKHLDDIARRFSAKTSASSRLADKRNPGNHSSAHTPMKPQVLFLITALAIVAAGLLIVF